MAKVLLALAATGILLGAPAWAESPQLESVIARVRPAVVLIRTEKVTGARTSGTGFIYDSAGYILTNHHVIEGATTVRVTLADGRSFPAEVAGFKRVETDDMSRVEDCAVLKIDAAGLPTLWSRSPTTPQEGQELLVLGFPGKLDTDRMSVTRGIVSAVRTGWIQTDAVIVPGNSGGPVIDSSGRLIGMATFRLGYELRFGGVMGIDKALDLAAHAKVAGADPMRIINVPGLEYFKPRDPNSDAYSSRHVKTWRVTASDGVYEFTREIDAEGNLHGASRYNDHRPGALSVEDHDDFVANTDGFFDMSRRVDQTWVRNPTPPLKLAELPLEPGRSWTFEETWTRQNMQELAQSRGAPPRPTSRVVRGETSIESTTATITVPAGTFRKCVQIATEIVAVTNLGDRAHWVRTVWYAPYVGEVKRVFESAGSRVVSELREIQWIR